MNFKMMSKKEIEKRVYETYPETKLERECTQEKKKMDHKRSLLKKRLMNQVTEKREFK